MVNPQVNYLYFILSIGLETKVFPADGMGGVFMDQAYFQLTSGQADVMAEEADMWGRRFLGVYYFVERVGKARGRQKQNKDRRKSL